MAVVLRLVANGARIAREASRDGAIHPVPASIAPAVSRRAGIAVRAACARVHWTRSLARCFAVLTQYVSPVNGLHAAPCVARRRPPQRPCARNRHGRGRRPAARFVEGARDLVESLNEKRVGMDYAFAVHRREAWRSTGRRRRSLPVPARRVRITR
jgi:hypothetical protein